MQRSTVLVYSIGLLLLLMGAAFLLGEYILNGLLAQVNPALTPMQTTTALLLSSMGLSLIFAQRLPKISLGLAIVVSVLSGLALIEYSIGINHFIDQLFQKSYFNWNPFRHMAKTTVICLFLAGLTMIGYLTEAWPHRRIVTIFLSALVITLSSIALIGYIIGFPAVYSWGNIVGMAFYTSWSLILLGIGLLVLNLQGISYQDLAIHNSLPILMFIVGNCFFLVLWHSMVTQDRHELQERIQNDTGEIKTDISSKLWIYRMSMIGMEQRIQFELKNDGEKMSKAEWLADANHYVNNVKAYQALALSIALPNFWIVKSSAKNLMQPLNTCVTQISSQGMGVSYKLVNTNNFCILVKKDAIHLVGLIDLIHFLRSSLNHPGHQGYHFFIKENQQIVSLSADNYPLLAAKWKATIPLHTIDPNLQLIVWPNQLLLKQISSYYPYLSLLAGSVIASLLALTLYFVLSYKRQGIALLKEVKKRATLESRFKIITTNARDAIVMVNNAGKIVFWNRAATEIFQYTSNEALHKYIYELILPLRYREFYKKGFVHFEKTGRGRYIGKTVELLAVKKDGEEFPIEVSTAGVKINGKQQAAAIIRDITQRKKIEAIVHHQAYYDALTDLANRSLFEERLNSALWYADRQKTLVGLLFIDVDKFKQINDRYDHHIGDEFLKKVANCLRDSIRISDTAARLGGDEFAVILTNLHTMQEIVYLVQKIFKKIDVPFVISEHQIQASCSIGVAVYPEDAKDAKGLLKQADHAMYKVKRQGGNSLYIRRKKQ